MSESSFSYTLADRGFTRFVLLRPRDAVCPTGLADALRERWHQVTQVYDPLNALAELCLLDRAEQPRRDWGLESKERIALIFFEQDAWSSLNELLKIVKERLPAISVWNCTDGLVLEVSKPTTHAVRKRRPPSQGNTPTPSASFQISKEYGTLRLTGSFTDGEKESDPNLQERKPQPAPSEAPDGENDTNPNSSEPKQPDLPTVSAEELELLLGLLDDGDESRPPSQQQVDDEHNPEQRRDPQG